MSRGESHPSRRIRTVAWERRADPRALIDEWMFVPDTIEQARIPLLGTGGASATPHPGRRFAVAAKLAALLAEMNSSGSLTLSAKLENASAVVPPFGGILTVPVMVGGVKSFELPSNSIAPMSTYLAPGPGAKSSEFAFERFPRPLSAEIR